MFLNKNANFISSFGEAYSLCFYLEFLILEIIHKGFIMMTDLLDEYIALLEHNLIPFLGISFLFYKSKKNIPI